MTAKKMFEALGYELEMDKEEGQDVFVYGSIERPSIFVAFVVAYKEYYTDDESAITVENHKAIHQQMKELGWLE